MLTSPPSRIKSDTRAIRKRIVRIVLVWCGAGFLFFEKKQASDDFVHIFLAPVMPKSGGAQAS